MRLCNLLVVVPDIFYDLRPPAPCGFLSPVRHPPNGTVEGQVLRDDHLAAVLRDDLLHDAVRDILGSEHGLSEGFAGVGQQGGERGANPEGVDDTEYVSVMPR